MALRWCRLRKAVFVINLFFSCDFVIPQYLHYCKTTVSGSAL